jgi:hypothetical protein
MINLDYAKPRVRKLCIKSLEIPAQIILNQTYQAENGVPYEGATLKEY